MPSLIQKEKFTWKMLLNNTGDNVFRHFILIATVKSLQSSRLFQILLLNNGFRNAFVNPKGKIYMWKLFYSNYEKKQFCLAVD